jgi:hypothetical protein
VMSAAQTAPATTRSTVPPYAAMRVRVVTTAPER